eukprot:693549-Prorocentrum_minimum.AAC.1
MVIKRGAVIKRFASIDRSRGLFVVLSADPDRPIKATNFDRSVQRLIRGPICGSGPTDQSG